MLGILLLIAFLCTVFAAIVGLPALAVWFFTRAARGRDKLS